MMEHENKNRNSNGLLRRIVIAVLLVIMIGSALSLVKDWRDAAAQRRLEESLAEAAKQTETEPPETEKETEAETEAPYVSPIDFTPLLETNPDTIGWIRVPDTKIDYPIVQSPDNQYYLHKDFEGNDSVYGAIYLDADSKSDFSGWNNPIYGHHMKDRTMFASIDGYKEQWYYDAHPCLYVYTNAGTYRVDLFAGLIVPGEHEVFNTSFQTVDLERFISQSTFYAGRGIPTGRIVGLCTCSYEADNYRYVVLGEMTLIAEG